MPTKKYRNLFSQDTPVVFADGTTVYKDLAKKHIQHNRGYFIMAPSGAGKTHFIEHQKEPHWLDGDDLWQLTNAHPDGPWWTESLETIIQIDERCDVITTQAKKLGFWVLGASNSWMPPDAIVIPDWETHKKWIGIRETTNYDGGATTDRLDGVKQHREWILQWEKKGVPKFETVDQAAEFLAKQYASQKS